MKKLWNAFLLVVVLSGFPFMAWVGSSIARETYAFWRHGFEDRGVVASLTRSTRSRRGWPTYHYELDIQGQKVSVKTGHRISLGSKVTVLRLSYKPDVATLGSRASDPFSIFSDRIGSRVLTVGIILMFLLTFGWALPGLIYLCIWQPTRIRAALCAWINRQRC